MVRLGYPNRGWTDCWSGWKRIVIIVCSTVRSCKSYSTCHLYQLWIPPSHVHVGSLLVLPITNPFRKCLLGSPLCSIINLWLHNIFYNIFSYFATMSTVICFLSCKNTLSNCVIWGNFRLMEKNKPNRTFHRM
jgi:uncharacterized membrane protein